MMRQEVKASNEAKKENTLEIISREEMARLHFVQEVICKWQPTAYAG